MPANYITYGGKYTIGNTSSQNPTTNANLNTGANCKVIVLGILVSGTSAIGSRPTFNGSSMIQIGSAVATTEGNVELWYTTSNVASKTNANVSYNNRGGILTAGFVSWYDCADTLYLGDTGTKFSTNGSGAQINLISPNNNSFVAVDVWHSGYSSVSGITNNRTELQTLDRGSVIGAAQYGISSGTSNYAMLHTTPLSDDYAMIAASFYALETSSFASINGVSYASMTSVDGVPKANIGNIDEVNF